MPFRAKLKAAFGRSSDEQADLTKSISKRDAKARKNNKNKTRDQFADWPEHIYKPYEMPQPKYKRPPAKEHTEKLEAFSFGESSGGGGGFRDSLRRLSHTSLYSPMGSRLPSRTNSIANKLPGARNRPGTASSGSLQPPGGPSRSHSLAQQSVAEEDEGPDSVIRVKSNASARRQRSSRPGTSAQHDAIQEHSSAERSPASPGSESPGGHRVEYDTPLAKHDSADADGGPLAAAETVRPRANTARNSEPLDGQELSQALTAIQVERPPAAVGA